MGHRIQQIKPSFVSICAMTLINITKFTRTEESKCLKRKRYLLKKFKNALCFIALAEKSATIHLKRLDFPEACTLWILSPKNYCYFLNFNPSRYTVNSKS